MFFIDPIYLLFIAPGLILALGATFLTKTTFAKYAKIPSSKGITGSEAASIMLRQAGVQGVSIEPIQGTLSDHYDPTSKTLRLSEPVYHGNSLAAVGIACHEAGHAIQHAYGYAMLSLRTALVPATNICSTLYVWVIFFGAIFTFPKLILLGISMCGIAVVFSLVTLPVEWDASARAKKAMVHAGLLSVQEKSGAEKVLNAAFLTYLASAITAIMTLVYYLYRYGLFSNDD